MKYYEYKFFVTPIEPYSEILIAFLNDLDFETFIENDDGFCAYTKENYSLQISKLIENEIFNDANISFSKNEVEDKNWNEEWEKDFPDILIDNKIHIRAEFHPKMPEVEYEIIIQPKMSFGTGHHSTTYLMLQQMSNINFQEKDVLDMGSGTSILAIFAKMKDAKYVEAIDIDDWAYENSIENARRNNVELAIRKGDVKLLDKDFDIILANINKNILMNDISIYVKHLKSNGLLLLSGIMDKDFEDISETCNTENLQFIKHQQKNNWLTMLWKKN